MSDASRTEWAKKAEKFAADLIADFREEGEAKLTVCDSDLPEGIPHRWFGGRISEQVVQKAPDLKAGAIYGGYCSTVVIHGGSTGVEDHLEVAKSTNPDEEDRR